VGTRPYIQQITSTAALSAVGKEPRLRWSLGRMYGFAWKRFFFEAER
jgi:hypothetical protein